MSSQEFSIWLRYNQESPISDDRGDLQAGIIASTVANMAGRMLAENVTRKPSDYMPLQDREPDVQSESDPGAWFQSQAQLFDRKE